MSGGLHQLTDVWNRDSSAGLPHWQQWSLAWAADRSLHLTGQVVCCCLQSEEISRWQGTNLCWSSQQRVSSERSDPFTSNVPVQVAGSHPWIQHSNKCKDFTLVSVCPIGFCFLTKHLTGIEVCLLHYYCHQSSSKELLEYIKDGLLGSMGIVGPIASANGWTDLCCCCVPDRTASTAKVCSLVII